MYFFTMTFKFRMIAYQIKCRFLLQSPMKGSPAVCIIKINFGAIYNHLFESTFYKLRRDSELRFFPHHERISNQERSDAEGQERAPLSLEITIE